MSASALERHDLEQDIDELRGSIESLQSSRDRLKDLVPSDTASPSAVGSIWSELSEVVSDFFELAGEAIGEGGEDEEEAAEKTAGAVKKLVMKDWSKPLGDAFGKLRDRVFGDTPPDPTAPAPVAELNSLVSELDSELARLNADLARKLDRIAELDRAIDVDDDAVTPVQPHHRDVVIDDPVVVPHDDIDVTPIPVDPVTPVVHDDIVLPHPDVHVDVVVVPPVIDGPVVDPAPVVDDTPAYDKDKQTEIGELDGAVYDVNEILKAGRTVADLRRYDVPAGVVKDAGVSASAMLDGGYTVSDLHEAGYQAGDLHGLAGAADLRGAGFSASDLHGVFTATECLEAFSPHELRDAGFSLSDFHGLVSASDLRDAFSVGELRTVFSIAELHEAGFGAADLNAAGVGWDELAASGFSLNDLESAGASEATLRNLFPGDFPSSDDDDR